MRYVAVLLALALLVSAPLAGFAKPTPGGGGGGRPAGGGGRPAGNPRPSAQAPAGNRGAQAGGGFNFNRDVSAAQRPSGGGGRPNTSNPGGNRPGGGSGNRPGGGNGNNPGGGNRPGGGNGNNPGGGNRPGGGNGSGNGNVNRPGNGNGSGNGNNVNIGSGNNVNVNRPVTVVSNPVYHGGAAWGWNHGVVWAPAYGYWGGGFWGAFAIGVGSAAVFGAIVNSTTHQTVTSYQVQPGSPGATMLSNYQLTQTQCGPPNLVVVYGPNDSVICAMPNNLVAAGNYNLDSSNLSLTSM